MALDETRTTLSRRERVKKFLIDSLLIILLLIGIGAGVALGLGLRTRGDEWAWWQKRQIHFLRFPGDLLMNMLKMLILPLIISSLVSAMAGLNPKSSGKMGICAVVYYLTTTFIAVIIGIVLVLTIQPGFRGGNINKTGKGKDTNPIDALLDLIRNCFPNNLVAACFEKQQTTVNQLLINLTEALPPLDPNMTTVAPTTMDPNMTTTPSPLVFYVDHPKVGYAGGTNVLGLVVFSIFFGAIIASMGKSGRPLYKFFLSLHLATMKLIRLVIWFSPIGIMFLLAAKLVETQNIQQVFTQLAYYAATVLAGLAIHAIIVLPLIYLIFTRKNPYKFAYGMLKAMAVAWGTASSSATLPVTMKCLEDNNSVDMRVTQFVAPIGATINMDGTALYEAVASIFIAQANNIYLDVGQVITVSLTSTAAAIGAAGVPEAGLVTMAIVLTAVGLPTDDIALILAIDWFLDRFRTAINVLGDSFGAGIVEHLCRNTLGKMDTAGLDMDLEVDGDATQMHDYENNAFEADTMPPKTRL